MNFYNIKRMLFILMLFLTRLHINSKCKILLPIETLSLDNYIISSNISHQRIMKSLLYQSIYTIIEIGTPFQKIPLFIDSREYAFEITSFSPGNSINNCNMLYNLSSIFDKYDFFKENKSSSFKTKGCTKSNNMYSDHLYDCFSYDTINLKDNSGNRIDIKNFEFNLVKQKEENITGILGLGLFDKAYKIYDINKSFLIILKNKGIIQNYNWYFLFNSWNDTQGKLVIGSLPHEDFPDYFHEDDLVYTYIPIDDFFSFSDYYKIGFDEIKTNTLDKTIDIDLFDIKAELNFDSNAFISPKYFETDLRKKFMKNFEINGKCFRDSIKQSGYIFDLFYYYCKEEMKNTLYESLPFIKFVSKDLNYTFEITKDELYKIEGDYIYLNILFDYGKNYWTLGKPFSLKYHFVFNQDSKKIGLYRNFHQKMNINNNTYSSNQIINIFLKILLCLSLIFIGFIIGKKIYKIKRKVRANELNDNYEYINESNLKDVNNKHNISNEVIGHEEGKNFSIEMGIKS